MLRRIPKVLLLVALLTAFAASSAPAFSSDVCECFKFCPFCKSSPTTGGCKYVTTNNTSQCVNTGCKGYCAGPFL